MSTRSPFCRCERPVRCETSDGARYCADCEELLPSAESELLAHLIRRVDKLSRAVATIAPEPEAAPADLIDAEEAARRLGVSRDYVYSHADELGAVRLGDGPRARLRFDPSQLRRPSPNGNGNGQLAPANPRARRPADEVELLPIRGGSR